MEYMKTPKIVAKKYIEWYVKILAYESDDQRAEVSESGMHFSCYHGGLLRRREYGEYSFGDDQARVVCIFIRCCKA